MNTLFQDEWRKCLIASLEALIRENRNLEGIKEAMSRAGFTGSEIQAFFVTETLKTATPSDIQIAMSFTELPNACS